MGFDALLNTNQPNDVQFNTLASAQSIFFALSVISSIPRVKTDLLVVLLQGSQVLASENSPSSMPSPTYQWTKALLAYIRSNLWSNLAHASAMAVVLDNMHTALLILARSPPGTMVGGW